MSIRKRMTKHFCFLLIAAMLFGVGSSIALADGSSATLEIVGADAALPGETVNLSVNVSNMSDIAMIQFVVEYNSEMLELVSASKGSALPTDVAPTINSTISGKLYFIWETAGNTLSGSGTIMNIQFKAKEAAAGETVIRISENEECVFADSNFVEVVPTLVPGTVTIGTPAPASYGKISGMGAELADSMMFKIYVKNVAEGVTPVFQVVLNDDNNKVLAQSADEDAYALSKYATYLVKWNASQSRWEIMIKVYGKWLASAYTLRMYDRDTSGDPLPLEGYAYQGIGDDSIAAEHAYTMLDYFNIMKTWKPEARYIELYNSAKQYGDTMKLYWR